jgi:hypothetical protein
VDHSQSASSHQPVSGNLFRSGSFYNNRSLITVRLVSETALGSVAFR